MVTSARYLLLGFAAISALGMLTALRANHLAQLTEVRHETEAEQTAGNGR